PRTPKGSTPASTGPAGGWPWSATSAPTRKRRSRSSAPTCRSTTRPSVPRVPVQRRVLDGRRRIGQERAEDQREPGHEAQDGEDRGDAAGLGDGPEDGSEQAADADREAERDAGGGAGPGREVVLPEFDHGRERDIGRQARRRGDYQRDARVR